MADLSSVFLLQDTLQVLFGLLSNLMLPAKPNFAHTSIAKYIKRFPNTPIVTTNHDCCMDIALDGAHICQNYCLEFENAPNTSVARKCDLTKLHGSLNWYYCETCQEVQLVNTRQTIDNFVRDIFPYPVIGICKGCGGQRRGLLIPPLSMKFDVAPPLSSLLNKAQKSFENSDVIIVVGFSFADADVYISRILSKSMQKKASQKLSVVDPDYKIAEKISRKLQANIPNFSSDRVISIPEECTKFLPPFLSGSLLEGEGATKKAGTSPSTKRVARQAKKKRPSQR